MIILWPDFSPMPLPLPFQPLMADALPDIVLVVFLVDFSFVLPVLSFRIIFDTEFLNLLSPNAREHAKQNFLFMVEWILYGNRNF